MHADEHRLTAGLSAAGVTRALGWIREFLIPCAAEQDLPFRQELARLSHPGLQTLGAVEIAVPLVLYLARLVLAPSLGLETGRLWQTLTLVAAGLGTTLVTRTRFGRQQARRLTLASAGCAAALLIWGTLLLAPQFYRGDDFLPAGITLVLLAAVAAVPLLPLQVLALGVSVELLYALSHWLAQRPPQTSLPGHDLFLGMLAILSTAIAGALYRRRRSDYCAHQEALRIAEALSGAQLRAQLAENAVAIGKLAAAVTHEINNPLGTLCSSVDTLLVVAARQATASPDQQQRLVTMQADLRKSVQSSIERIRAVIARLQRFINLEEAELQAANLNELLGDVAILYENQVRGSIKLEFDFQPVPTLMCRPQLLSAVFSSLLSNAINAVNGDGLIVISTRRADGNIEVRIRDNGRGMSPAEIETIFDPCFKVSGSRVSSGNWSLFNSRQIIFEHGGDIQIDSVEGHGTTVSVTLPCQG